MMTGGGRGVKNAENLMTSYVNDPLAKGPLCHAIVSIRLLLFYYM